MGGEKPPAFAFNTYLPVRLLLHLANELILIFLRYIRELYRLRINCKVSQNGWRDFYLNDFLKSGGYLRRNKSLDFFIESTNCPPPYDIYWKIRNVGYVAEERDCIRGEIKQGNAHHKESTDFYGEHFVECYLVKSGICVAQGRIDVPIGNL